MCQHAHGVREVVGSPVRERERRLGCDPGESLEWSISSHGLWRDDRRAVGSHKDELSWPRLVDVELTLMVPAVMEAAEQEAVA